MSSKLKMSSVHDKYVVKKIMPEKAQRQQGRIGIFMQTDIFGIDFIQTFHQLVLLILFYTGKFL